MYTVVWYVEREINKYHKNVSIKKYSINKATIETDDTVDYTGQTFSDSGNDQVKYVHA